MKSHEIEKNSENRSFCPIACTLDIVGDKWSLLIIRDLLMGKTRYDEFLNSPEKISTNILAERLKKLEKHGILTKEQYGNHASRMNYRLTEKGQSLAKMLKEIIKWGLANISGTAKSQISLK